MSVFKCECGFEIDKNKCFLTCLKCGTDTFLDKHFNKASGIYDQMECPKCGEIKDIEKIMEGCSNYEFLKGFGATHFVTMKFVCPKCNKTEGFDIPFVIDKNDIKHLSEEKKWI